VVLLLPAAAASAGGGAAAIAARPTQPTLTCIRRDDATNHRNYHAVMGVYLPKNLITNTTTTKNTKHQSPKTI
jgi:hypothetical protein